MTMVFHLNMQKIIMNKRRGVGKGGTKQDC